MIRRLEISGLVVIERAELDLPPGLVAITGETGAGKSVLMQSLTLLAGGPADSSLVRPGHAHALVQAVIGLPDGFWDGLSDDDPAGQLRELVEDECEVVVARRIPADGRARAFVDGQVASREAVGALVRHAVRFSGQGDQRALISPAVQMDVLDAFSGPAAAADARGVRRMRRELAALDRRIEELHARRDASAARVAELTALVEDAAALGGGPDELAGLRRDRDRMRNAGALLEAAGGAAELLAPHDGRGARELVGDALARVEAQGDVDPGLADNAARLVTAQEALQDAAIDLRAYVEGLDADPARLASVEDRIDQYVTFERRHGVAAGALERAVEDAAAELEGTARDLDVAPLVERRAALVAEARQVADRLHTERRGAAPRLGRAIGDELAALSMGEATLRVEVERGEGDVPLDACVFRFRANPGLPETTLADAASGGELSRVLLAIHAVAQSDSGTTWVFDEIDAGVGGTTAGAVASRLARMGRATQVVVITHLPAVAAVADAHVRLVKTVAGDVTSTRVEPLAPGDVEDEVVRMLGGEGGGVREHARELLRRAGRPG